MKKRINKRVRAALQALNACSANKAHGSVTEALLSQVEQHGGAYALWWLTGCNGHLPVTEVAGVLADNGFHAEAQVLMECVGQGEMYWAIMDAIGDGEEGTRLVKRLVRKDPDWFLRALEYSAPSEDA